MHTPAQDKTQTEELPSFLGLPEEWKNHSLVELGKLHQRAWKYHTRLHTHVAQLCQEQEKIETEISQLEKTIFALGDYMRQLPPVSLNDSIVTLTLAIESLEFDKAEIAKQLMVSVRKILRKECLDWN